MSSSFVTPPRAEQLKGIARRVMAARGLLPDFAAAVRAEADAITSAAHDATAEVRDLRGMLWVSIDNEDSRELDQLSAAVPLARGAVKILVAVADVDAIVKAGSAIDGHARTNTTSVYTAAETFSMLPEKIATDFISLREGQRRLAVVAEITVAETGAVQSSELYRAVVVNRAQLAYDTLATWLDGTRAAPEEVLAVPGLEESLRVQDRAARAMQMTRQNQGTLSLETSEARSVFHAPELADLEVERRNRAKDLIESLIIASNDATARYLQKRDFPLLRRVLRSPERWARVVELARNSGERLPSEPNGLALEEFLQKRRALAPSRFPDLSRSVVKLLGRGEYALERASQQGSEQFARSVKDHTRSPAPNRRFSDLLGQRVLKAAIAGRPPPYGNEELRALAEHCTQQEDQASKVERQVRKSESALLLDSRIGERFDAIVTGASTKGNWALIVQPFAEGKIVAGADKLDVGQRIRVELIHTDVEHGFIDFALVERS